jgi:hypothetical protein
MRTRLFFADEAENAIVSADVSNASIFLGSIGLIFKDDGHADQITVIHYDCPF